MNIKYGCADTTHSLIMSGSSIWECEHERDRRQCHDCFSDNELDRLIEGHFKQFYLPSNSNKHSRQRDDESDDAHISNTTTEPSDLNNIKNTKRVRGVSERMGIHTVDTDYARSNVATSFQYQQSQSISGLFPIDERDERISTSYDYIVPSINANTDSICRRHTPTITNAIDYESKCSEF